MAAKDEISKTPDVVDKSKEADEGTESARKQSIQDRDDLIARQRRESTNQNNPDRPPTQTSQIFGRSSNLLEGLQDKPSSDSRDINAAGDRDSTRRNWDNIDQGQQRGDSTVARDGDKTGKVGDSHATPKDLTTDELTKKVEELEKLAKGRRGDNFQKEWDKLSPEDQKKALEKMKEDLGHSSGISFSEKGISIAGKTYELKEGAAEQPKEKQETPKEVAEKWASWEIGVE